MGSPPVSSPRAAASPRLPPTARDSGPRGRFGQASSKRDRSCRGDQHRDCRHVCSGRRDSRRSGGVPRSRRSLRPSRPLSGDNAGHHIHEQHRHPGQVRSGRECRRTGRPRRRCRDRSVQGAWRTCRRRSVRTSASMRTWSPVRTSRSESLHNLDEEGTALDKDATADASASGGGLLVFPGAEVHAVAHPQTTTSVRDGATMQAMSGEYLVTAESASKAIPKGPARRAGSWARARSRPMPTSSIRRRPPWAGMCRSAQSRPSDLLARSTNTADARRDGWQRRSGRSVGGRDRCLGRRSDRPARSGTVRASWPGLCCRSWPRWRPRHTRTATSIRTGLGADADTDANVTFVGSTTTTIGKATLRADKVSVRR